MMLLPLKVLILNYPAWPVHLSDAFVGPFEPQFLGGRLTFLFALCEAGANNPAGLWE